MLSDECQAAYKALGLVLEDNEIVRSRGSEARSIVLPEGPTSIGNRAFVDFFSITSITLPESLQTIGDSAFSLTHLNSINIPPSVSLLDNSAFLGCESMTTVSMPGVTRVGNYAFHGCGLTDVDMPNVIECGEGAFSDCTNLQSVNMPSLKHIGQFVFHNCTRLEKVVLPDHAVRINFHGCDPTIEHDPKSIHDPDNFYAYSPCFAEVKHPQPYMHRIKKLMNLHGIRCLTISDLSDMASLCLLRDATKKVILMIEAKYVEGKYNDLLEHGIWVSGNGDTYRLSEHVSTVVVGCDFNHDITHDAKARMWYIHRDSVACITKATDPIADNPVKKEVLSQYSSIPLVCSAQVSKDFQALPTEFDPAMVAKAKIATVRSVLEGSVGDVNHVVIGCPEDLYLVRNAGYKGDVVKFDSSGFVQEVIPPEALCSDDVFVLYGTNIDVHSQTEGIDLDSLPGKTICLPYIYCPNAYQTVSYDADKAQWFFHHEGSEHPVKGVAYYDPTVARDQYNGHTNSWGITEEMVAHIEQEYHQSEYYTGSELAKQILCRLIKLSNSTDSLCVLEGSPGIGKDFLSKLAMQQIISCLSGDMVFEHITAGFDLSIVQICQRIRKENPEKNIMLIASEINLCDPKSMDDLAVFLMRDKCFKVLGTQNSSSLGARFDMKCKVHTLSCEFTQEDLMAYANQTYTHLEQAHDGNEVLHEWLKASKLVKYHQSMHVDTNDGDFTPSLRQLFHAVRMVFDAIYRSRSRHVWLNPYFNKSKNDVYDQASPSFFMSHGSGYAQDDDMPQQSMHQTPGYRLDQLRSEAINWHSMFLVRCDHIKWHQVQHPDLSKPEVLSKIKKIYYIVKYPKDAPLNMIFLQTRQHVGADVYWSQGEDGNYVYQEKQSVIPLYSSVCKVIDHALHPEINIQIFKDVCLTSDETLFFRSLIDYYQGNGPSSVTGPDSWDVFVELARKVVLEQLGVDYDDMMLVSEQQIIDAVYAFFNAYYDGHYEKKPLLNGLLENHHVRNLLYSFINHRGQCRQQTALINYILKLFGFSVQAWHNKTHAFITVCLPNGKQVIFDVGYFGLSESKAFQVHHGLRKKWLSFNKLSPEHKQAFKGKFPELHHRWCAFVLDPYLNNTSFREDEINVIDQSICASSGAESTTGDGRREIDLPAPMDVALGGRNSLVGNGQLVRTSRPACSYTRLEQCIAAGSVFLHDVWNANEMASAIASDTAHGLQRWFDLSAKANGPAQLNLITALAIWVFSRLPKEAQQVCIVVPKDQAPAYARHSSSFKGIKGIEYVEIREVKPTSAGPIHECVRLVPSKRWLVAGQEEFAYMLTKSDVCHVSEVGNDTDALRMHTTIRPQFEGRLRDMGCPRFDFNRGFGMHVLAVLYVAQCIKREYAPKAGAAAKCGTQARRGALKDVGPAGWYHILLFAMPQRLAPSLSSCHFLSLFKATDAFPAGGKLRHVGGEQAATRR